MHWRHKGYHLNYGADAIKKFSSLTSSELQQKIKILILGAIILET